MKKILITGGACAGKTTVLEIIKNYLTDNNYDVTIFEEVPTKLINNGITPDKIGRKEFQELIIRLYKSDFDMLMEESEKYNI